VTNVQDYSPYGEIINPYYGGGHIRKYLFTEERDLETGYDYFGARYYDSYIGHHLTRIIFFVFIKFPAFI
jgi:Na+/proline symporter